ncbi:protein-L-isoaspartate(D-aspartate) O-methyltransferase [Mariniphaga anaerophila]|uniref:Protein-L-isoaspartate O-methyltransferase n=1 Tax=Mariniphaga anaerophila TaxID=1484053 RepID=A0A1M5DJ69_9BACT|nr:protein-L-isoaspartate(D-aspartate) O-methyltransferase [Mariniphaga anaerophila]SHF66966.1 protein-L-isoaspartate(D-aspartate) O-methyltransferase [Mariniphaga anaerophila]
MTEFDNLRHQGMRKRLVDGLKIKGIRDESVLAAIGKVPRHLFMESSFLNFSYKDQAFPIGAGQTISQPYTVAFQSQLLQIQKNEKVLEVGTGSGYQAAVLVELGAKVFTIERQKELFRKVQSFLPEIGYHPACFFGDGYEGLPAFAPFDKILVTAGAPLIPVALKEQLKIGGRLVIPVGKDNHQEMQVIVRVSEDEYKSEKHGGFVFVPLLKGVVNI